jgi:hypothetical protein
MLTVAGCSGARRLSQRASRSIPTAGCVTEPLALAPLPGEVGVYRAGPLTLAVGDDSAQHPGERGGRRMSGSEAIAVLTGSHPAVLSVDPTSRGRFALQFTPYGRGHPSPVLHDVSAAQGLGIDDVGRWTCLSSFRLPHCLHKASCIRCNVSSFRHRRT